MGKWSFTSSNRKYRKQILLIVSNTVIYRGVCIQFFSTVIPNTYLLQSWYQHIYCNYTWGIYEQSICCSHTFMQNWALGFVKTEAKLASQLQEQFHYGDWMGVRKAGCTAQDKEIWLLYHGFICLLEVELQNYLCNFHRGAVFHSVFTVFLQ